MREAEKRDIPAVKSEVRDKVKPEVKGKEKAEVKEKAESRNMEIPSQKQPETDKSFVKLLRTGMRVFRQSNPNREKPC